MKLIRDKDRLKITWHIVGRDSSDFVASRCHVVFKSETVWFKDYEFLDWLPITETHCKRNGCKQEFERLIVHFGETKSKH